MKRTHQKAIIQKYIKITTSLAAGMLVSLSTPNEAAALNGQVRTNFSPVEFIDTVDGPANRIATNYGLYPSVMVAQAALESNYGNSQLAAPPIHNLFGIKAGPGEETVLMSTAEYLDGQWIQPSEPFKKYPNYGASMLDNAQLLRNGTSWDSEYYAGSWVENTETYQDATESLKGRYATDPNYNEKLDNLIEAYDLTENDTEVSEKTVSTTATQSEAAAQETEPVQEKPQPIPENTTTYTIQTGDTLYAIANRYEMTVSELQRLNGLNSSRIHPGQTVQVKGEPQPTETPQTVQSTGSTYTVELGDTLDSIANRSGMSVSELKNVNGLNSNNIQLGQTLAVNETVEQTDMTQSTETAGSTYTVESGDTLYSIAIRTGMSVSELKNVNGLNSNNIQLGQTLAVNETVEPTPSTQPTETASSTYTVESGDTLYSIANRAGMSVSELKNVNGLNSNNIQLGQTLAVKEAVEPTQATQTTASAYTVASGDTLYSIANQSNMSVSELQNLNGLTSTAIHIGQNLQVKNTPEPAQTNAAPTQENTSTHTVSADETLYSIANSYGTTVAELQQLNQLNSNQIKAGQTLEVNGSATTVSENETHTVASGDTLYNISNRYDLTVDELKAKNNLSSNEIQLGQELQV